MKSKFTVLVGVIILSEVAIYFWSVSVAPAEVLVFQLSARYSARLSFFLLSAILLYNGIYGLKQIFLTRHRESYLMFLAAFAINHVIHFYYLAMNHWIREESLLIPKNAFGSLAYLMLIVLPVYLWKRSVLTRWTYSGILFFLLWITALFAGAYIRRFGLEFEFASSGTLLTTHLVIITILLALNIYRIIAERKVRIP